MSKFEMQFELKGLKVSVKGERGDIPLITQNIGKQIGDLLKPAANIVDEQKPQLQLPMQNAIDVSASPMSRRKRGGVRSHNTAQPQAQVVEVAIDPATWGAPQQSWKCVDKAIWLLFVTSKNGGPSEMTSAEIVRIFNGRYRAAKEIRPQNVNRDLTRVKSGTDALVGRSEKSGAWFLTEAGEKHALALITRAREAATPSGN